MIEAFDRAGITAAFMEPEEGGVIVGPKNLELEIAAFELAGCPTLSTAFCGKGGKKGWNRRIEFSGAPWSGVTA